MSNINAAIGLAQLRKADHFIACRRKICRSYDDAFQNISGLKRLSIDYSVVAPHIYVIRVSGRRDALCQFLMDRDIETGVAYIPNHLHSFYREEGVVLQETEKEFEEILSLPLHSEISDQDVKLVIGSVMEFLAG